MAVIDRLPVPFGLVRYGVAPDHHSIRSIRNTLERTLEKSDVRFFGDVTDRRRHLPSTSSADAVDAVIYAYGAGSDKRLEIPVRICPAASRRPSSSPGTAAIRDVHPDSTGRRSAII